jgi:transcriptional regulator with GAF, ATPase, and Fis domain
MMIRTATQQQAYSPIGHRGAICAPTSDVVGQASPMRERFDDLERIATSVVGLLMEAETGTGNELVAAPTRTEPTLASSPLLPLRQARREANAQFERDYLTRLLHRSGGNITRAAALAKVSRQMVQKLLRRTSLG